MSGAACTAGGPDSHHNSPQAARHPDPTPPGEGWPDRGFAALVAPVTAEFGDTAGIAVSDGAATSSAGELSTGPAWSTIKVPIAVAALRSAPT